MADPHILIANAPGVLQSDARRCNTAFCRRARQARIGREDGNHVHPEIASKKISSHKYSMVLDRHIDLVRAVPS